MSEHEHEFGEKFWDGEWTRTCPCGAVQVYRTHRDEWVDAS